MTLPHGTKPAAATPPAACAATTSASSLLASLAASFLQGLPVKTGPSSHVADSKLTSTAGGCDVQVGRCCIVGGGSSFESDEM